MKKKLNVLIIGAGPTGLTAALHFAKNGIAPIIMEKRKNSSTLSRAVGIMPASLDKLGKNITQKILSEGLPFMKINMHIDTKRILNIDFKEKVKKDEFLIGLPQDRTEELIKAELETFGIEINYGTEVTNVKSYEDYVDVWFNHKQEAEKFDWVIACDGVDSITRRKLNIGYQGYDLDDVWSIADLELNEGPFDYRANNVWMKVGENYDTVVSLPIGQNRIRLISTSEDCIATIPLDLDIRKINRKGNFKVSIRQIETYKKGRVLFAGDSAHCHSPVGGKGMNLGIDDAVAAVKSIVQGTTEGYSKERHIIGAKVIRKSESMRKMIMSKSPIVKYFLRTIFGLINKVGYLQQIAVKGIAKLY